HPVGEQCRGVLLRFDAGGVGRVDLRQPERTSVGDGEPPGQTAGLLDATRCAHRPILRESPASMNASLPITEHPLRAAHNRVALQMSPFDTIRPRTPDLSIMYSCYIIWHLLSVLS